MRRAGGDRRTEAMTLSAMSHLEAMRGESERAREHYARSRSMLTELGFSLSAAITSLHSGPAEMLAGNPERAEAELRADYETLRAMGDTGCAPPVAGLLAEALHAQGRDREAADFAGAHVTASAAGTLGAPAARTCQIPPPRPARRDAAEVRDLLGRGAHARDRIVSNTWARPRPCSGQDGHQPAVVLPATPSVRHTSSFPRTASMTALVKWSVKALPPRSAVRVPRRTVSKTLS